MCKTLDRFNLVRVTMRPGTDNDGNPCSAVSVFGLKINRSETLWVPLNVLDDPGIMQSLVGNDDEWALARVIPEKVGSDLIFVQIAKAEATYAHNMTTSDSEEAQ